MSVKVLIKIPLPVDRIFSKLIKWNKNGSHSQYYVWQQDKEVIGMQKATTQSQDKNNKNFTPAKNDYNL